MSKKSKPDNEKLNTLVMTMTPEIAGKLKDLAKRKYRGVNRVQALRWMIEDAWKEFQKDMLEGVPVKKEEELSLDI